jgi:hypothetical protein
LFKLYWLVLNVTRTCIQEGIKSFFWPTFRQFNAYMGGWSLIEGFGMVMGRDRTDSPLDYCNDNTDISRTIHVRVSENALDCFHRLVQRFITQIVPFLAYGVTNMTKRLNVIR